MISEWNPFHNGHKYLAEQIRRQLPSATIVAVMSGNFVQRGEPAVVDKWSRAETALTNGYDLIYELPIWYATQPADYFAFGAVGVAVAIGCEYLAFGVETSHFSDYERLADWVVAHPAWEKTVVSPEDDGEINRSQGRLQALEALPEHVPELEGLTINFSEGGNTLLAYAYAKANAYYGHPLTLLPISRHQAAHDLMVLTESAHYTSSTAIRNTLKMGTDRKKLYKNLSKVMPPALAKKVCEASIVPSWEICYPFLRYMLLSQPEQVLSRHYQIYEGIESVLKREAKASVSYSEFLDSVTNRQWTVGRIQRALLMVVLGIREAEAFYMMQGRQPLFLLGTNSRGRRYLKHHRGNAGPHYASVNRVSRDTAKEWPLWLRADTVYQEIFNPEVGEQNFGHVPLLIK